MIALIGPSLTFSVVARAEWSPLYTTCDTAVLKMAAHQAAAGDVPIHHSSHSHQSQPTTTMETNGKKPGFLAQFCARPTLARQPSASPDLQLSCEQTRAVTTDNPPLEQNDAAKLGKTMLDRDTAKGSHKEPVGGSSARRLDLLKLLQMLPFRYFSENSRMALQPTCLAKI